AAKIFCFHGLCLAGRDTPRLPAGHVRRPNVLHRFQALVRAYLAVSFFGARQDSFLEAWK
ncbi:MAG: hypothetical protein DMF24_07650, partial [Verrucomicrobia bacterium]